MFEVVFDYDEGHFELLPPDEEGRQSVRIASYKTREWSVRSDPFSVYRASFEVRTYRLCHRVLMLNRFPEELGVADYLVRSSEFAYDANPVASFITKITQSGYVLRDDGTFLRRSLPPVELEYSQAVIRDKVCEIDAKSLENLPYGLDDMRYKWADLNGEGLSGILTEQAGAWFYKPNLGGGTFGPVQIIAEEPSLAGLNSGQSHFMDLNGDGLLDLVKLSNPAPGFYERSLDEHWKPFKPFPSLPNIDWNNPNLKFLDLTGDGLADIIISEDQAFTWYESKAREGFSLGGRTYQGIDEEIGPLLIFSDAAQSVYLADMSGDGLTDLVRIRKGEVCYWPNMGYGRFGAKVTMDRSPQFEQPDLFSQQRVRLADIDGSGTVDLIYLGSEGVQIYFNQSGNGWSEMQPPIKFPEVDSLNAVTVVDLLGNGTACLVWSSSLPGDEGRQMRYIDLMGGEKPHLLISVKNNLGAETRIRYAPSTKFYLQDLKRGKPWITRLPFPVFAVESLEIYDWISRNRFVTSYAYHHGYYDGVEREFRGFGMIEQLDTEEFAALSTSDAFSTGDNICESSHIPPVLTKSWFHTGAYIEGRCISRYYEDEYYLEPGLTESQHKAMLLPDTCLPPHLCPDETREACRSLKGSLLRQEIYALDNSSKSDQPYSVSESNFTVRTIQPRGEYRYAIFFTHPRETVNYHYERDAADPRVGHSLTLEVDAFGNVLKSAAIGYGRRQPDVELSLSEQAKQTQILIAYSENSFTNCIDLPDDYRTPVAGETRAYELTGLDLSPGLVRFSFDEMLKAGLKASKIAYETMPSPGVLQKRLIEHNRTIYRRNDLSGPLPLGQIESKALPYKSCKMAFTPGLLEKVYGDKVTESMLINDGRYVHSEGDANWWISSGRVFFSPDAKDASSQELAFAGVHFYQPHRFQDPFGQSTMVAYDKYDLLLKEVRDPLNNVIASVTRDDLGNEVTTLNYRVLQPYMVTDPNGNRSSVAFDAMGMVVGTAVMGKPGEKAGDSLEGFEPDLDDATIHEHIRNPLSNPHEILQKATNRLVYDLYAFQRTSHTENPEPSVVYTLARETHEADLIPGQSTKIQHSFSYSDGFGREIQKKMQAEPGEVDGLLANPRWVGSGWTIFNNKGKPVKKYEPFFSLTRRFEFAKIVGVSSTLFYDPLDRVVATLHPNHTYEKVVFDPWRQETWDVNDTVLQSDLENDPDVGDFFQHLPVADYSPTWYESRKNGQNGPVEKSAAEKAAAHSGTPTVAYFDALGRPFLAIADNGADGKYRTTTELDIEGNQRAVIDARSRTVMKYDYDILSTRIRQSSMEAGIRWMLNDVAGKPI